MNTKTKMSFVAIKEEAMDTTANPIDSPPVDSQTADQLNDNDNNNSSVERQMKSETMDTSAAVETGSKGRESGAVGGGGSRVNPRRGRKNRRVGGKVDVRAKLERSRQSARECRARKKLRYQYLEDLVIKRESANVLLKSELQMYREIFKKIDSGHKPQELLAKALDDDKQRKHNRRA